MSESLPFLPVVCIWRLGTALRMAARRSTRLGWIPPMGLNLMPWLTVFRARYYEAVLPRSGDPLTLSPRPTDRNLKNRDIRHYV